jgi:hypothetical protein
MININHIYNLIIIYLIENQFPKQEFHVASKAGSGAIGKGGRQLFLGGLTPSFDLGQRCVGACLSKLSVESKFQLGNQKHININLGEE